MGLINKILSKFKKKKEVKILTLDEHEMFKKEFTIRKNFEDSFLKDMDWRSIADNENISSECKSELYSRHIGFLELEKALELRIESDTKLRGLNELTRRSN